MGQPLTLLHNKSQRAEIENKILSVINNSDNFLSTHTINSPRAAGDAIERLISKKLEDIIGKHNCKTYSENFARRAMADIAFEDQNGIQYYVDVKTHRTSTKFNMPNLTSVQRLSEFYKHDNNVFSLLLVSYDMNGDQLVADKVFFVPIEFLDWECLTIGALGWGQIQIANSNVLIIKETTRKLWMTELCNEMLKFYPKEIGKIGKRVKYFEKIIENWQGKPE